MSEDTNYNYINPDHYKASSVETIDKMVAIYGEMITAYHCELCAFKYRERIGNKPNQPIAREIEKIKWYEDKAQDLRKSSEGKQVIISAIEWRIAQDRIKQLEDELFEIKDKIRQKVYPPITDEMRNKLISTDDYFSEANERED